MGRRMRASRRPLPRLFVASQARNLHLHVAAEIFRNHKPYVTVDSGSAASLRRPYGERANNIRYNRH